MSDTRRKGDEDYARKNHSGKHSSKNSRFTPHGKDFSQFLDEDELDELEEMDLLDRIDDPDIDDSPVDIDLSELDN